MKHSDIQSNMADYLEGDLALDKRLLFDAHLNSCEGCSAELSAMRDTIGLLRRLPTADPPADLADRVMQRIAEGEGQPALLDRVAGWLRGFGDLSSWVSAPRFAVPISAVAVGLAAALLVGDGGPTRPGLATPLPRSQPVARQTLKSQRVVPQLANQKANEKANPKPDRLAERRAGSLARNESARVAPLGMRGTRPDGTGAVGRAGRMRRSAGGLEMASAQTAGAVGAQAQATRTRDEWLDVLIEQPRVFAREHRDLSSVERELWVTHLSRRAVELGRLAEVVAALRATRDPVAVDLARFFAAPELRVRASLR